MKRITALLLALVMVFALCACGNKTEEQPNTNANTNTNTNTDTNTNTNTNTDTKEPDAAPAVKWPNGDVTILAGYAVGSLTDVNVRTIADWITQETGATVIVENNDVGGGANLATKLVNSAPDGQTLMCIGMNCISNYYNGIWEVNPADSTKFKIVAGSLQPFPDSGCIILTQPDAPYSTWEELADYAAANPGTVTVASIAGKVMDIKMKAMFNLTGVADNIRWVSTTNADATAGLLGGIINCIMLDETTAAGYIADGSAKPLINCRADEDWSLYGDNPVVDTIKDVPTLMDVFGADASKYMVPNRSMFVVPAGTPDEICAQIAAVIDKIDEEPEGSEFYERCRVNGGTSKYYTWPGDEIMAEWERLDPVIAEIVKMG